MSDQMIYEARNLYAMLALTTFGGGAIGFFAACYIL